MSLFQVFIGSGNQEIADAAHACVNDLPEGVEHTVVNDVTMLVYWPDGDIDEIFDFFFPNLRPESEDGRLVEDIDEYFVTQVTDLIGFTPKESAEMLTSSFEKLEAQERGRDIERAMLGTFMAWLKVVSPDVLRKFNEFGEKAAQWEDLSPQDREAHEDNEKISEFKAAFSRYREMIDKGGLEQLGLFDKQEETSAGE